MSRREDDQGRRDTEEDDGGGDEDCHDQHVQWLDRAGPEPLIGGVSDCEKLS